MGYRTRAARPAILLAAALLLTGLLLPARPSTATPAPAAAPQLTLTRRADVWQADNRVSAMLIRGSTLYIAGFFDYIGPDTGGFIAVDPATGTLDPTFPRSDLAVQSTTPDGAGGLLILTRDHRLLRLKPDGTFDPAWNILVPIDYSYDASVLAVGGTLFVGGISVSVGADHYYGLAAYDIATRAQIGATHALTTIGSSFKMASSGTTLFLGGDFSAVDGQPRVGLAAFDSATGALLPWAPQLTLPPNTSSFLAMRLAAAGGAVYVMGHFTAVNGQPRDELAAVDAATGATLPWSPQLGWAGEIQRSYARAMTAGDGQVFISGGFSSVDGQPRAGSASFDIQTGQLTSWSSGARYISDMWVYGGRLYLHGDFVQTPGRLLAAYDIASGQLTDWDPRIGRYKSNDTPIALSGVGGRLYITSSYTSANGAYRHGLAAIDLTTGAATPWAPDVQTDLLSLHGGNVTAMLLRGGTLYIGGSFERVNGQPRRGLAAVGIEDGALSAWAPAFGELAIVETLAGTQDTLFVGGQFLSIDGQPRENLAAFNLADGSLSSWRWDAGDGDVRSLAVDGLTLYAAGGFTKLGGVERQRLASFELVNGGLTSWSPTIDTTISALAVRHDRGTVVVGGEFASAGGQPRAGLAEIDRAAGQATGWDAGRPAGNIGLRAAALLPSGDIVYAAGANVQCPDRCTVAALDGATGAVLGWLPDAVGLGLALASDGHVLAVGTETGLFVYSIDGLGQRAFLPTVTAP